MSFRPDFYCSVANMMVVSAPALTGSVKALPRKQGRIVFVKCYFLLIESKYYEI